MKCFGQTTVRDILGDFIVFRNLMPLDPRLPKISEIPKPAGISDNVLPRKSMKAYGEVITHLLKAAQKVDHPQGTIKKLIYIGDTLMNDGNAFSNICNASGWQGMAFIGADRETPLQIEIEQRENGNIFIANRWKALDQFCDYLAENKFCVDEQTAVVLDLDKTLLGARGRNDQVINQKRVDAARETLQDLLGNSFDPSGFENYYNSLNKSEFHPFTGDNQDYLVYICLILGSGLYRLPELIESIHGGKLSNFEEFIQAVDDHAASLPKALRNLHKEILCLIQKGDPTPFKSFRQAEYRNTVLHMGILPDSASVEEMLNNEIVITNEIKTIVAHWKNNGALLFGLSDKPDEATIPSSELADKGFKPIHEVITHVIGEV